ncbi:helix-turn-helix transcriptional regulator [Fluviicola sp.]|uniref:helix-turn-helix domain-containing protein n=1 Tax=Fluviicola sp. TaxID=1917219 RepID=UPI0031CF7D2A
MHRPDFSVMENGELLLTIAKRLKELRNKKGVTQEDVYNDTGIHVARIEQGKRDISFTTLCKLADYFGVDLNGFR